MSELRVKARDLSEVMDQANLNYEVSVQTRDLEKVHDHLFFKSVMRNYDDKRKGLK